MTQSGPTIIRAYPGEVRQVLLNLVRNACEATERSGARVTVKLTGDVAGVQVVVADEGTGIDPAVLPRLFQFGSSTKGDQGNGMGLWTVRHILHKARGEVTVQSVPGEGTRFTLWWPRGEATEPRTSGLVYAGELGPASGD